jgi:hypothetical protein
MITVFVFNTSPEGKKTVQVKRPKAFKPLAVSKIMAKTIAQNQYDFLPGEVEPLRSLPKKVKKPKVNPIEQNPLVCFFYYSSALGYDTHRVVRVISANEFYLIGLQVNDKNRFKRFRRDRISGLKLEEFAPASMSK